MAITTTLQVGTINWLTDTFTSTLDLNDRVTFFTQDVSFMQPDRVYSEAFNMRTPGVAVQAAQYGNGAIKVRLFVQAAGGTVAILSAIHNLFSAIEQPPYYLKVQLAGGTQFTYYPVVKVTKPQIPYQAKKYVSGIAIAFDITFTTAPKGITLPRQILQNLVGNPGFEAPSGPGVVAFTDTFANTNAYSVVPGGGTPTVAGGTMTIPASTTVTFGSPAWGTVNTWQVRFQWFAGQTINFHLHRIDGNNNLFAEIFTNTWSLNQTIAGTNHALATAAPTTLAGNFYWAVLTQFPTVTGSAPSVQAILYNDNAGAIGTLVSALGPVGTFDGATALQGRMAIQTGTQTAPIGGAFTGVHVVSLFGPGNWTLANFGTALASGAWEQTTSNTFPSGPVTSSGALRIDAPPAGGFNAQWQSGVSGSIKQTACPIAAPGNVIGLSAWVKSSGVAASCTQALLVNEFDSTGTSLRQSLGIGSITGTIAAWTQITSTYTTGANCAYVTVVCLAVDSTSASANGTVWFDNIQCWNQTTTGQTTMSYHELRFQQSPAQIMVSGLLGDAPAPAFISMAAFFASWAANATATYQLGRRATATKGMRLVTASVGPGQVLDGNSYGGYTSVANLGPLTYTSADEYGIYNILGRVKSANTGPANNVWLAPDIPIYNLQVLIPNVAGTELARWDGAKVYPISAANTWTIVNAGQAILPPSAYTNQTDLTQLVSFLSTYSGAITGGSQLTASWVALLPVDGGVASYGLANSGGLGTVTNQWLYLYSDGVRGVVTHSRETNAIPNPTVSGGLTNSLAWNPGFNLEVIITSGSDSVLYLDPTVTQVPTGVQAVPGVNQFLLHAADGTAATLPVAVDMSYYPAYLFPR